MEKQKLPNAIPVLILGILSIPACGFYGVGLLLGIIALVIAKKELIALGRLARLGTLKQSIF